MTALSIAIDGPAASGKSSLAKALARKIGLVHLETGALYRCVALAFLKSGGPTTPPENVRSLLSGLNLSLGTAPGDPGDIRFFMEKRDVTDEIRSETVGKTASAVAAIPEVREFLLPLQRSFARQGRVVMDGRDIGTVILPDATLKIFLSAPAKTRAKRRWLQLGGERSPISCEEILLDLENRDRQDLSRSIAPLVKAPDALDLDNSRMTIGESVDWIVEKLPR